MLTRTDDDLAKTIMMDEAAYKRHRTLDYLVEQEKQCPVISRSDGVDLTERPQQLGRPLTHVAFERRLKKLVPHLVFKDSPNPTLRSIFLLEPGGHLEYVTCHPRGIIPEHSVMRKVIREVLDPEFMASSDREISRTSPEDTVTVEDTESPFGFRYEFNPEMKRPGMKYVPQGHGEAERGWRTVLLRLIVAGHTTVDAVEREFGADNRAEWAHATKKRVDATPTW
jgi:hypothetical protein